MNGLRTQGFQIQLDRDGCGIKERKDNASPYGQSIQQLTRIVVLIRRVANLCIRYLLPLLPGLLGQCDLRFKDTPTSSSVATAPVSGHPQTPQAHPKEWPSQQEPGMVITWNNRLGRQPGHNQFDSASDTTVLFLRCSIVVYGQLRPKP